MVHVQDPSVGLHFAPLEQWQVELHPEPQVPSEQRAEQFGPCQPKSEWKNRQHKMVDIVSQI